MKRIQPIAFIAAAILSANTAYAQIQRTIFPSQEGKSMKYNYYNSEGKLESTYVTSVRDVKGNMTNGSLKLVYTCHDADGKAFFDAPNEFVMSVSKVNGQTNTAMDQLSKMIKVQNLLPAGDASTIPVDMKVGQTLPNSTINVTVGKIKVSITISEKKVMEHKTLKTKAGSFDAWLVHEKISTKTPFGTTVQLADSWYSEGFGSIMQTVYNAKGELKGRQEIISAE